MQAALISLVLMSGACGQLPQDDVGVYEPGMGPTFSTSPAPVTVSMPALPNRTMVFVRRAEIQLRTAITRCRRCIRVVRSIHGRKITSSRLGIRIIIRLRISIIACCSIRPITRNRIRIGNGSIIPGTIRAARALRYRLDIKMQVVES